MERVCYRCFKRVKGIKCKSNIFNKVDGLYVYISMYSYDNSLRINFAAIAYQRKAVCQSVFLSCSVKSVRHYTTTVSLHTMV